MISWTESCFDPIILWRDYSIIYLNAIHAHAPSLPGAQLERLAQDIGILNTERIIFRYSYPNINISTRHYRAPAPRRLLLAFRS